MMQSAGLLLNYDQKILLRLTTAKKYKFVKVDRIDKLKLIKFLRTYIIVYLPTKIERRINIKSLTKVVIIL